MIHSMTVWHRVSGDVLGVVLVVLIVLVGLRVVVFL